MIAVATLLQILNRADVTEVCLTSGQRPVARQGQRAQEIGAEPLTSDDLLQILFSAGGSRYVDSLGQKPAQWRTRIEGVAVQVSAAMNGDVIEARFALKDAAVPAAAVPAAAPPPPPPPPPPRQRLPSSPSGKAGPRSSRNRVGDAAPSSRRSKAARSPRPAAPDRSRITAEEPTAHELADEDDDGDRPSALPTPPRGTQVPREAMRSVLELDLEVEIPSIPRHELAAPELPPPAPARPVAQQPPQRVGPPPLPPRSLTPPATMGVPQRVPPPPPIATSPRATNPPPGVGMLGDPSRSPGNPMVVTLPPPQIDESPTGPGPMSPRTLPEARFSSAPPSPTAEPRTRHPGRTTQPFARDPHTPALRRLLRMARELNASDLHLCADRPPMVRVVGQVVTRGEPLDPGVVEDMVLSRVPRRLELAFERDGSCDFSLEEPELGRFRVNVARFRGGLKASLRLIPLYVPSLPFLGLPTAIAAATRHHQGLIVLTGPTGHGKTTTLAAVIDILNTETTRHVITVEDPIEYVHPRKRALMSQREVGTHTRTFHSALKGALREDPDVIVVGELRDTETVRMALEASETGHLVLGTMSTPSAAKAIDRLIDLFPPGDQQQVRMTLAGGLRLIVSQRLLPDADNRAMVAAAEVLPGVVQLWNMIRDNRTYQIPSFQQRGRELGVIRLDDSLRDLVRSGKTTAAAALAVAEAPEELEQSLGIRRPTPPPFGAVPPPSPSAPANAGNPNNPVNGRTTAPLRPEVKPPEPPPQRGIFDRVFKKGV
jgi:twitching motility protein PilT